MHHIIAIGLLAIGLAATSHAAPRDYQFDMNHSRIFFDVDHLGLSTMLGRFADFDGTFRFDPENPTQSSLDIRIDPASIDMFHDGLNAHLRNPDFFDIEQYPEMRFRSSRVERAGDNRYTVHGELTMIGQTHPVSFDVTVNQTGTNRAGAPNAGFTATGTLDRRQWGMNFAAPAVGGDVDFRIEIEAAQASN
jgi:polyisoprenoid-binding protein YceI